jgi:hypothetical protein
VKNDTLIDLLDAECQRAYALLSMQAYVENEQFEAAMNAQFNYLYWCDEWNRLYPMHIKEYWALRYSLGT